MRIKYLVFTLLLAVAGLAFGADKLINAPSGDLILDSKTGNQVIIKKEAVFQGGTSGISDASATVTGLLTHEAQTIGGAKTFVSTISGDIDGSSATTSDSTVVRTTGNQSVGGIKTFDDNVGVGASPAVSRSLTVKTSEAGASGIIGIQNDEDTEVITLAKTTSKAGQIEINDNTPATKVRISADGDTYFNGGDVQIANNLSIGGMNILHNTYLIAGAGTLIKDLIPYAQDGSFIVEAVVGHHGGSMGSYGYKRWLVMTTSYQTVTTLAKIHELDSVIVDSAVMTLTNVGTKVQIWIDNGAFSTQGTIKVTAFYGNVMEF